MNPGEMIKDILAKRDSIQNVFFVACGGSLVEFYPPKYFMDAESKHCGAFLYSGKEFVCAAPASLGEHSLVPRCWFLTREKARICFPVESRRRSGERWSSPTRVWPARR